MMRLRWTTIAIASAVWASSTPRCPASPRDEVFCLDGRWSFQLDRENAGTAGAWFAPEHDRSAWRGVCVPHTWQVDAGSQDYMGIAWYARDVGPDPAWAGKDVAIEFDAVYRDVKLWLNGQPIGEHIGSGWTAFGWSLTGKWDSARTNRMVLRVDNRFSENALPYSNSSDWAADGGIIRSVRLRITPPVRIDRVLVHADADPARSTAAVNARVAIVAPADQMGGLSLAGTVFDPGGSAVLEVASQANANAEGPVETVLTGAIEKVNLWHFDRPALYRFRCRLMKGATVLHENNVSFGIRRIEIKQGRFFLNNEPMRLMGVEWMPGSDPRYGMAEPPELMEQILADMKRLNCVITRFHWQQDPAVFEFCDRNGILVQEEVPAWGGKTTNGELPAIQEMHMLEMILSHCNHPSIFAWGLCNEIFGQTEKGHTFVRRGIDVARRLDPHRLLTYASNALQKTPEKDASSLVDFVEWNDYYESWYGRTLADLEDNLRRIQQAFPDKTLLISEYGLCECTPKHPTSDQRRIEILRTHTDRYRAAGWVAGAIFFDYNDYRTHIGDKGKHEFRQRVHGVVDLLGRRKPSWQALREESSPVRSLRIGPPTASGDKTAAEIEIVTRSLENDLPAYTLTDYLLIWTAYNNHGQPIAAGKQTLPLLAPGTTHKATAEWPTFENLVRIHAEVFRPTGYSVIDTNWESQ